MKVLLLIHSAQVRDLLIYLLGYSPLSKVDRQIPSEGVKGMFQLWCVQ